METPQPTELEQSFELFRLDVIKALASIEVEIYTLQMAAVPGMDQNDPVDQDRPKRLRREASIIRSKFEPELSERIALAHQLR